MPRKIKFTIVLIFLKIEFLDTIWDFLTVCLCAQQKFISPVYMLQYWKLLTFDLPEWRRLRWEEAVTYCSIIDETLWGCEVLLALFFEFVFSCWLSIVLNILLALTMHFLQKILNWIPKLIRVVTIWKLDKIKKLDKLEKHIEEIKKY